MGLLILCIHSICPPISLSLTLYHFLSLFFFALALLFSLSSTHEFTVTEFSCSERESRIEMEVGKDIYIYIFLKKEVK